MPVSAVQIVVGSHQHCGELRFSLASWRRSFTSQEKLFLTIFSKRWMTRKSSPSKRFYTTSVIFLALTLNDFSALFQTSDKNGFLMSCCG